jgi:hypothetical protein
MSQPILDGMPYDTVVVEATYINEILIDAHTTEQDFAKQRIVVNTNLDWFTILPYIQSMNSVRNAKKTDLSLPDLELDNYRWYDVIWFNFKGDIRAYMYIPWIGLHSTRQPLILKSSSMPDDLCWAIAEIYRSRVREALNAKLTDQSLNSLMQGIKSVMAINS